MALRIASDIDTELSAGTDAAVAALWHAAVCADVAGAEVVS